MDSNTVRSVERAIEILEVIKAKGGETGVSTISRETGYSKSTVFRLLNALRNKGMVRQNGITELYSLGHKVIELAFSASTQWDIISLAMPYLETLRDQFSETAALSLRLDNEYSFIAQAMSQHEYRVNPTLGERYSLNWAGTGKVILAFQPREIIMGFLQDIPNSTVTQHTITDRGVLEEQIDKIKNSGFAYSYSERVEGGASICAPICDDRGVAQAAVSLIGPEVRFKKMDIAETGKAVVQVSKQIEMIYKVSGVKLEKAI